ncbi:MAG: aminotransferase class V-fold PLP-dependent enzyme [Betaproteobacteria bacterium]|nr:aminotransferase class V-fold PLP-dependent enzyme [Betaproteobacteria bacterium]
MNDTVGADAAFAAARSQFPGARRWTYLETSARGLVPQAARGAVDAYLDACIEGSVDKKALLDTIERVRAKFAQLVRAKPDEIAIVKNVSEGFNAFVASIRWQPGDNAVLCDDVDHPNCIYALYNMRDRNGIEVRSVRAQDHREPVDKIIAALDARTRLVIASSVPFTTGLRTDLKTLGAACRERGILFLVDGAQSVGALDLDVNAEKLDGLAVSSSKYLCGFYGFGFLYVRHEVAEKMQPAYLARYGIDLGYQHGRDKGGASYRLMRGARRFDLGAYNFAAASAIEVSLDLLLQLGTVAIERHVLALANRFARGIVALGLPLLAGQAGPDLSQVVLVGGVASRYDAASLLNLHEYLVGNGVKVSQRHGRLRFSFHLYNTEEDVDKAISLLRAWVLEFK